MKKTVIALCLGLTLFWVGTASAVLIDPYDNILPPDGFYGLFYGNYYQADQFNDSSGNKAADIDLTAKVGVLRGLYYRHLGKVPLAFQLIVPFGELKETQLLQEKSSGLGDVTFGPAVFLYNNDDNKTYLSYWLYLTAPTGEWNRNQTINLGQNHWYFQHQIALEKLWNGFVYDMNLNYYQHQKESDNDYQAPDRFEVEASLAYHVTEKFLFGLHGGGYWDRDEAEVGGISQPDSKARRIQFGPTLAYQLTDNLGVNLRWTHDVEARNDTEGDDVWLRFAYAF